MEKQRCKTLSNRLIIASFLIITFMMASKLVYIAQRTELMQVFGMDDVSVNLGMTFYFIVYAATQLLLSVVMGKLDVKKYLVISILISCVLTTVLSFSTGKLYFWIVLSAVGIFHAGVWAGCMHFLTKHLPTCMLPRANTLLTCGFPVGTVCSYAIASLCVALKAWWLSFVIVSVLFCLVLGFFVITLSAIEKIPKFIALQIDDEYYQAKNGFSTTTVQQDGKLVSIDTKFSKALFYAIVGLICFLVYAIYSSIIDFIPSMLKTVHSLDDSLSILFSVAVPVGVVFGPIVMINLCEKFKNYYAVALIGSLILVGVGIAVLFGYSSGVVIAIVLLLIYALLSRAVCSVFETVIVSRMKDQISVGGFAAYTNATASIGAAAAPAVMGVTIALGWGVTYSVILAEIILQTLLIGLLIILFVKNKNRKVKNKK